MLRSELARSEQAADRSNDQVVHIRDSPSMARGQATSSAGGRRKLELGSPAAVLGRVGVAAGLDGVRVGPFDDIGARTVAGADAQQRLQELYQIVWALSEAYFPGEIHFADIHAPATLAVLDIDLNVEPLLAAARGRAALGQGHRRPHLDQAAVLLASEFGRDVTRHCSLVIWDVDPLHSGIAYRSRHDLVEWCLAAYDRTAVAFTESVALSRDVDDHYEAVRNVAGIWQLPLERWRRR